MRRSLPNYDLRIEEIERSSYDDMVSIPSPRGLHLNTSPLSAQYRQRGTSTSSLSPSSPGSWKNSLEELSKGLQRICSSPSKELCSPLATTDSNDQTALNNNAIKRQTSDHLFRFSYSSLSNLPVGTQPLRVRHEESRDTLQKRLSQISGYKMSSEEDVRSPKKSHQREPSKDIAFMVSRRLSSSHKRINITVDIGESKQEDLIVMCEKGELVVKDISKSASTVGSRDKVIHTESLPMETALNKIMCAYGAKELYIRERSKPVLQLELSKAAEVDPFHCPVFKYNDNGGAWKMSWYLTEKFSNQNISIKTVDNKLVIICRSKRLSMLMNHMELSQDLRNSYNQNGLAMRYRGGLQMTLELPEDVDARSVTAYATDDNQLIVQGKQSGSTDRCMTL